MRGRKTVRHRSGRLLTLAAVVAAMTAAAPLGSAAAAGTAPGSADTPAAGSGAAGSEAGGSGAGGSGAGGSGAGGSDGSRPAAAAANAARSGGAPTSSPARPSTSTPRPSAAPTGAGSGAGDTTDDRVRARAAAEQRARDAAADRQARAEAAAERRAERLAAASQRARASWESRGRPDRLIVIRERSVDLVTDGALTRQVPRSGGALTLSTLDRFVPADWLSIQDGTARLDAAVSLTRGTQLTLGDPRVQRVRLAGGPAAGDAASIHTGRGALALRGVTVDSVDPATGQPVAPGPGRPFLAVSGGARFTAVDSAVNDLGGAPGDPTGRPAVGMGIGSTGSVVRTSFAGNGVALRLDRTDGVRLEGVAISGSAGDGLVLRGDTGTALVDVTADRNGGNGVLVTGPPSAQRPVTGISASGNTLFGVALLGQHDSRVAGVTTADNALGGLRVSWSTGVTVADLRSTGDDSGIYTHVGSSGIAVDGARIVGARRGLQIEKTTRDLTVARTRIDGPTLTGIALGGKGVRLHEVAVTDAPTGMRVERGAADVTAEGLSIRGGQDGIVALSATSGVVLRNPTLDGVVRTGIRTFSRDLRIDGGRIAAGATGVDAGAATTINGTSVIGADEGIRARGTHLVDIEGATVSAASVGINVAAGSPVRLAGSQVDALEAVRGQLDEDDGLNVLSLPPLNLLGAIGVPLVLLAFLLEQVRAVRQRGSERHRRMPPSLPAGA